MFSLLLGGCGGGGGGSSAVPGAPVTFAAQPQQPPPTVGTSTVAISLVVPTVAASSTSRHALYISSSTKSMAIVVNGGAPNLSNCTSSCSTTITAPLGTDTFAIALYDGQNGTGNILSSGSTTSSVLAGRANSLTFTLNGVVASVAVALSVSAVTLGTAATIPVSVVAKDAQGNAIIGSEPYASPITLTDSDASGTTALSSTSVTSPSSTVTLSYNGGASFSAATIAPAVAGVASTALAAAHLGVSAPAAAPASVPAHVQTWLYYGLDGINTSLPASYVAAHADYAESDIYESDRGVAFKNAGGKYSVAYVNPGYTSYCAAPLTPPAGSCQGPMANLHPAEDAFFHGADGQRVNHYIDSHFLYEEAFNPASPSTQNAFHTATQTLLAASPSLDYFFADDAGGELGGGAFYGFNEPEVEITTDAAFIAGRDALYAAATRPLIINGVNSSGMPSYNGAFIDAANVGGNNHEGCFSAGDTGLTGGSGWTNTANGLLANVAHRKAAVCMSTGATDAAHRAYFLASWWMTYEPQYSVAAPVTAASDGYAVFPEFDIVPTSPLQTATADVTALRSGGAYVREFGACYQARTPVGRCAAIVNTSNAAVAMPSLSASYTKALAITGASSYTGGTATWTGTVPAQLAPLSAVILAQ